MAGRALRWGILSCGKISHDFARAMTKCERPHEIVAVAARDQQKAEKFVEEVGANGAKAYGDYEQCIRDPNVGTFFWFLRIEAACLDIVYVGTIHQNHCPLVQKAVEAKRPVLCEKPFGVNAREVRETLEFARQQKIFVMEGTWSKFFPAWQEIRRIVRSGELGEPRVVHVVNGQKPGDAAANLERGEIPLTLFGLYPLMFTHFVFGRKPLKMTVTGEKNEKGIEEWANCVIDYGNRQHAVAYYTNRTWLPQDAFIAFDKGILQLPSHFWCPERMLRIEAESDKTTIFLPEKRRDLLKFPLNDDREFNYVHSSGLRYEADHVYDKLQEGALESDIMPHRASVEVAEMLDEVRRLLGIEFPHDKRR